MRLFHWCSSFAAAALILTTAAIAQQERQFPDIEGTWHGPISIAFSKSHGYFPDGSVDAQYELDIYRQQDNLIWVEIRWRNPGDENWVVEEATGSFDLYDPNLLTLSEGGPQPTDRATTGSYRGRFADERLYLTYQAGGVSFSTALERKPE